MVSMRHNRFEYNSQYGVYLSDKTDIITHVVELAT